MTAEEELDNLAMRLAQLVEIFRQGEAASDFRWWSRGNLFNPRFGYQKGQPLFEAVVQGIQSLNPEMLSEREIESRLIYDFSQMQTIGHRQAEHLYNDNLVNEAKHHVSRLIEFQAWQDVDIPIANLWHEREPVRLGYVTFMAVTKEDLEYWRKRCPWSERAPDVRVFAQVRAPGDIHKAIQYARTQVDLVLNVFRAFCFPFGHLSDTWQIGVVGDIVSSTETPMRINNRDFPTRAGASLAQIELSKHILEKLEQPQRKLINKLILKKTNSRSNMENKLLDGIHWLAESTKPDTNNAKLAKISFALETLIAGEPKSEELKVRGITAMLAERAAFIAGTELDDRRAIDKDIRKYYGIRSNVVHGSEGGVSLDNIDSFGQLVRRLALALFEKLDKLGSELSDTEKLAAWVREKKYTLPDNSKKEDT